MLMLLLMMLGRIQWTHLPPRPRNRHSTRRRTRTRTQASPPPPRTNQC